MPDQCTLSVVTDLNNWKSALAGGGLVGALWVSTDFRCQYPDHVHVRAEDIAGQRAGGSIHDARRLHQVEPKVRPPAGGVRNLGRRLLRPALRRLAEGRERPVHHRQ